ncbi:HEAT repeat domain-containing protein [Paenibacillus sp. GCM10027626]|uniref:HEAT repeat domain-containing protein n=1 Tax=Paenibacillus sp. GCM10027626 TaxID=3273411 RepID=UPI00363FF7CA
MKNLDQYISEGDMEMAIKIVDYVGETRDRSYLPILLKYLESTNSKILRNSIAIALSDIGDNIAVKPLIRLLENPKTEGSRGTLLYALENLDYSPHIELLTNLLDNSSFEISRHSFQLLASIVERLSEEQKNRCRSIIKTKIDNSEDEFLTEALELF